MKLFIPLFFQFLFHSGASPAAAESISVISLNTWGVPFASYDRWRYAEAMEQISAIGPDFVLLQEVFSCKGKHDFRNYDLYPYQTQGPRAAPRLVSSGLRILSKHPILRKAQLVYRTCINDDCLSRKGALLAVVRLPSGAKLNLVTTHLNARGGDWARKDQLDQLKIFLDYYKEPGAPILIGGDFNLNPTSPLYPKLLTDLGVQDTWSETHDASDPGYTSDPENNRYARDYSIRHGFPLVRERIDFLLAQNLKPTQNEVIFDGEQPLSDHYGLQASYELETPETLDLHLGMSHPVHDAEIAVAE